MTSSKIQWIRPTLSLIGFLVISYGFIIKLIEAQAYIGLVSAMIFYWFKSRDVDKANGSK